MIKIHFHDKTFLIYSKPMNFKQLYSDIEKIVNLDNSNNYIFQYKNSHNIYNKLDEANYNYFLDDNVTDIYIYNSIEEMKLFNSNNYNMPFKEDKEEIPNFYQEDNIDDNNINNIQQENFLKEKARQNIINEQKRKIRESKLKHEREKEEKKKSTNSIIIRFQNDDNIENDEDNKKIVDIIEKNFETFKENLINESKIQSTQIVMESKLKFEDKQDIETPNSVEVHKGSVCNGCGEFPIIGIRYQCVECKDFDYCEKCHEEKKYIHKHPFYKLRFMLE